MNTDTGRIYEPDVLEAARAAGAPKGFQGYVSYSDPGDVLTREQEIAELQRAIARGEAVPVSARVAQQQRLGQRELRRRKRRATKTARKDNR